MNAPLAQMLRYNRWATARLIEGCRAVPSEMLDAALPGTQRTVRDLLRHLVRGQRNFVLRTQGEPHEPEMDAWPGFDALAEDAHASSDELVAIAEALDTDRDVETSYNGQAYRYPVSFFLAHAVEHGTEHRTEIKVGLDALGIETPDLDGWAYSVDAGYGPVEG